MNVTHSTQKLSFPRFLTLKMVPKPFRNYPKIEVFEQFFKNTSKGFPDVRRSSQCILVSYQFLPIEFLTTLKFKMT